MVAVGGAYPAAMRLVHLAGYTPPQVGSFIPFLKSVLVEARGRGWEVEAVFPDQARERPWVGDLREAQIPVSFAFGSRGDLTSWLREHLGEGDEPTILHTHFTLYDVAAALIGRGRPSVSVYWHVHTVLSASPRNALANTVKFSLFGRYVDRILAPSVDLATGIRRRLGPRSKIEVFPSPIDPNAFPLISPEQRAVFREQLEVPEGTRALLHFGRAWELKGGDVLLDALALLAGEGRLLIALINQGGDQARGAAALRGLEAQVKIVEMLPEPQQLYGAADVLVAPSRGEGMPFTVVEALCSGTPVVASDLSGHRFFGDHLEACTIVPQSDSAQIAAAVGSYLDLAPEETERQAGAAHEWIVDRLDLRRAATRLVDEYEQTIDSGPARTIGQFSGIRDS